jgi:hypothetical protein
MDEKVLVLIAAAIGLVLAAKADGHEVTTVEGLEDDGRLSTLRPPHLGPFLSSRKAMGRRFFSWPGRKAFYV